MNDYTDKTMEAYFAGTMPSAEIRDFETALNASPELQQRLDEYVAIKKAASQINRDRLRSRLDDVVIEEPHDNTKTNVISNENGKGRIIKFIKPILGIAALFMLCFIAYNSLGKTTPEDIFAQNFEPYTTQQSRGKKDNSEIDFPRIDREKLNTPELKLLYTTMKLENNEPDEVIDLLTSISDDTAFRDQKYWYIGLTQLKLNKIEEAKSTFKKLQSMSNYKKEEIKKILKSIE